MKVTNASREKASYPAFKWLCAPANAAGAAPPHSREPQAGKGSTTLGARAGKAGPTTPHSFPAASYRPKLFKLAGNAAERAGELCAKAVHDGDNRGGYAGGNEAVFDGGRSGVIIHEMQDELSQQAPPLRYLVARADTMWALTLRPSECDN
jgi:hypothetical protein